MLEKTAFVGFNRILHHWNPLSLWLDWVDEHKWRVNIAVKSRENRRELMVLPSAEDVYHKFRKNMLRMQINPITIPPPPFIYVTHKQYLRNDHHGKSI